MLYYGIDEGNLMFENQSISNNPSVGNLIFLKNIIQFFDKHLVSLVTRKEENKALEKMQKQGIQTHRTGLVEFSC